MLHICTLIAAEVLIVLTSRLICQRRLSRIGILPRGVISDGVADHLYDRRHSLRVIKQTYRLILPIATVAITIPVVICLMLIAPGPLAIITPIMSAAIAIGMQRNDLCEDAIVKYERAYNHYNPIDLCRHHCRTYS